MKKPYLKHELVHWGMGNLVCGIDEVGRGCFAGPLTAAGVILKPNLSKTEITRLLSLGINDSKLVKENLRKRIIEESETFILYSYVQFITVDDINIHGIGVANKRAFQLVAQNITRTTVPPTKNLSSHSKNDIFFLTDCFPIPEVAPENQANIIHGDQTSISIALASIIAKVTRDTYMEKLAVEFPKYGFEKHKGYGTKHHREIIQNQGISSVHRVDFCKNYLTTYLTNRL